MLAVDWEVVCGECGEQAHMNNEPKGRTISVGKGHSHLALFLGTATCSLGRLK